MVFRRERNTMLIKDIMTRNVVTVAPDVDLHSLAELFIKKDISGAPVVDKDGTFLGVVLEEGLIVRDKKVHLPTFFYILNGFIALGEQRFEDEMKKMAATTVAGIMEKEVKTVTPETPLEDVATMIIDQGIHYYPVLENKKVVGIVTRKDIVRAIAEGKLA